MLNFWVASIAVQAKARDLIGQSARRPTSSQRVSLDCRGFRAGCSVQGSFVFCHSQASGLVGLRAQSRAWVLRFWDFGRPRSQDPEPGPAVNGFKVLGFGA